MLLTVCFTCLALLVSHAIAQNINIPARRAVPHLMPQQTYWNYGSSGAKLLNPVPQRQNNNNIAFLPNVNAIQSVNYLQPQRPINSNNNNNNNFKPVSPPPQPKLPKVADYQSTMDYWYKHGYGSYATARPISQFVWELQTSENAPQGSSNNQNIPTHRQTGNVVNRDSVIQQQKADGAQQQLSWYNGYQYLNGYVNGYPNHYPPRTQTSSFDRSNNHVGGAAIPFNQQNVAVPIAQKADYPLPTMGDSTNQPYPTWHTQQVSFTNPNARSKFWWNRFLATTTPNPYLVNYPGTSAHLRGFNGGAGGAVNRPTVPPPVQLSQDNNYPFMPSTGFKGFYASTPIPLKAPSVAAHGYGAWTSNNKIYNSGPSSVISQQKEGARGPPGFGSRIPNSFEPHNQLSSKPNRGPPAAGPPITPPTVPPRRIFATSNPPALLPRTPTPPVRIQPMATPRPLITPRPVSQAGPNDVNALKRNFQFTPAPMRPKIAAPKKPALPPFTVTPLQPFSPSLSVKPNTVPPRFFTPAPPIATTRRIPEEKPVIERPVTDPPEVPIPATPRVTPRPMEPFRPPPPFLPPAIEVTRTHTLTPQPPFFPLKPMIKVAGAAKAGWISANGIIRPATATSTQPNLLPSLGIPMFGPMIGIASTAKTATVINSTMNSLEPFSPFQGELLLGTNGLFSRDKPVLTEEKPAQPGPKTKELTWQPTTVAGLAKSKDAASLSATAPAPKPTEISWSTAGPVFPFEMEQLLFGKMPMTELPINHTTMILSSFPNSMTKLPKFADYSLMSTTTKGASFPVMTINEEGSCLTPFSGPKDCKASSDCPNSSVCREGKCCMHQLKNV